MKILGFVVLAMIFFVSGGKKDEKVGGPLKLAGWSYQVDVVNDNLKTFTEQTGIEADPFYNFPSNQYHDKLVTSFISHDPYDVVYVRDSYLAEWASAGWISPLEDAGNFDILKQELKELPQSAIDLMSYQGKLYGLPYYSGSRVMAYNRKHLAEAGLKMPTSLDELLQACRVLKQKGVVDYPLTLQLNKSADILETVELLTFAGNGVLFDQDNRPVFLENGSLAWTLNWIKSALDEGLLDPAALNSTDHEVVRALSAGTRTFSLVTAYNLKTLNDPASSQTAGDMAAGLIPGANGVRSGSSSIIRFYALSTDGKQKERALQLIKFLGGRDKNGEYRVATRWALEFGLGFVQEPLYENKDIQASLKQWIDPEVLREQAKYSKPRPYRFTSWFQEWQLGSWGELQKAILGQRGVNDVVKDLYQKAMDLIEQSGGS